MREVPRDEAWRKEWSMGRREWGAMDTNKGNGQILGLVVRSLGKSCEFLGNARNLASFTSAPITTQEKAGSLSGDSAACEEITSRRSLTGHRTGRQRGRGQDSEGQKRVGEGWRWVGPRTSPCGLIGDGGGSPDNCKQLIACAFLPPLRFVYFGHLPAGDQVGQRASRRAGVKGALIRKRFPEGGIAVQIKAG